jgi:hypothetical protein
MCAVCAGIRRRAFLAGMAEAFLHIQRKVVSSSSSPPAAVRDCLIRWRCLVNCPRFLLSYVPLFLPLSLPDSVAEFPFSSLINHPPLVLYPSGFFFCSASLALFLSDRAHLQAARCSQNILSAFKFFPLHLSGFFLFQTEALNLIINSFYSSGAVLTYRNCSIKMSSERIRSLPVGELLLLSYTVATSFALKEFPKFSLLNNYCTIIIFQGLGGFLTKSGYRVF